VDMGSVFVANSQSWARFAPPLPVQTRSANTKVPSFALIRTRDKEGTATRTTHGSRCLLNAPPILPHPSPRSGFASLPYPSTSPWACPSTHRPTTMALDERRQPDLEAGAASAGPASGLVAPSAPNKLWAIYPPSDSCGALCCRKGGWWVHHHLALDDYHNGPSRESLDGSGCWKAVRLGVSRRAAEMLALGLAPWDRLSPDARARFRQTEAVDAGCQEALGV
jgi:hypothetical protein